MSFTKPNDPSAGVNPASYAAQAEPDKVDFDIIVAGSAGTGVVSGCAVTAQGTPNNTVAVAAGTIAVLSAQSAVTGANVTVGNGDATNPRIDLIVSSSSGVLSCVAGTAAAVPCMPNVPAASVALAEVYRPPGATTVTSAMIRDCRVPIGTSVRSIKFVNRTTNAGGTSGYAISNGSWADLDATNLSLVITAAVGDVVETWVNGVWGSQSIYASLDVVSWTGSAVGSYFSTGTSSSSTDGIAGWADTDTSAPPGPGQSISGPFFYTVQAADLVSGQMTVRLRGYAFGASKTILASAGYVLQFGIKNNGPSA